MKWTFGTSTSRDTPSPIGPLFLILPKLFHQLKPHIQVNEFMGRPIQATSYSFNKNGALLTKSVPLWHGFYSHLYFSKEGVEKLKWGGDSSIMQVSLHSWWWNSETFGLVAVCTSCWGRALAFKYTQKTSKCASGHLRGKTRNAYLSCVSSTKELLI